MLATPSSVTASLVARRCPAAAERLAAIGYASVVFVALAFRREDVTVDPGASGVLVPRGSGPRITAVSWSSNKWGHRPDTPFLARAALGHVGDPDAVDLSDDRLLDATRADLSSIAAITAEPLDVRISRFRDAFPQYRPGHLDRTTEIERALSVDLPNVVVCGMAHRGVGIPTCVREARTAASELWRRLTTDRGPGAAA
ncbi:MAG: FAD-dependent oxidoreductase [Microthrixaceae bacterium]